MRFKTRLCLVGGAVALLALCAFVSPTAVGPTDSGSLAAPVVSIPDTVFVAEGREFNVWTSQLTAQISGVPYFTVLADCDSGAIKSRSWRWTPWVTGAPNAMPLTLKTIDPSGAVKRTDSTVVQSVGTDSVKVFQALFIGDSLMGGGQIVSEVMDLEIADGGADLTMLGTVGSGTDLCEGYSGKGIRYFTGSSSPFWYTDHIDFQSYMTANSYTGNIDFAVIQLGSNDLSWIIGYDAITSAEMDSLFYYTRALVDSLLSPTAGYPACRVMIGLTGLGALDQSAFGDDYPGASWWLDFQNNMRKFQNRMIAEFDAGAHHANVDVCDAGLWLDRTYGYSFTQAAVSARSDSTESYFSNYLHPSVQGFEQLADAYYSHLRWLMYQYDDPTPTCTNELADSHNFSTANGTYWTNVAGAFATYWTITNAETDPWGGTTASLFTATASVTGNLWDASSAVSVTDADVVASFFVKKTATTDTNDVTDVRIVDATDSAIAGTQITWAATPTVGATGTIRTAGGIEDRSDLGAGWYQIWVHAHLDAGRVGHNFTTRIGPVITNPNAGDAIIVAGGQLEFGVTTPCGTYVETP